MVPKKNKGRYQTYACNISVFNFFLSGLIMNGLPSSIYRLVSENNIWMGIYIFSLKALVKIIFQ